MKAVRKVSFIFRMRFFWLMILFCGLGFKTFAQEKQPPLPQGQIEGIVFDKDTKDRVARTSILNTNTSKSFYNNLQGEFKIDAKSGDRLVFNKEDYLPDTVIVKGNSNIAVYLQRIAIPLKEVTIRDSLATPQQRLLATKKEFSKAYGPGAYSDLLSTSPGSGAGLSIDAIFNSFSRSGRNAQHLQSIIQGDYQQNVIDYRFNRTFVGNITGLKDQDLTNFMIRYRPGYYMATTASDYDFISYVLNNYKRYKRNKRAYSQQPLITPKAKAKTAGGN
jgi:hypothetical protein